MNNLSPIFMVKRNHQYSITMDFVRDYEYPTLWGTETDHWTFEMVTPAPYKITKNGERYSLTDDPYGTSPIEAIYRHLYKVYKPLETL